LATYIIDMTATTSKSIDERILDLAARYRDAPVEEIKMPIIDERILNRTARHRDAPVEEIETLIAFKSIDERILNLAARYRDARLKRSEITYCAD
jgi:hypothetical protein